MGLGRILVGVALCWATTALALSGAVNESTVADGKVRVRCSDNTLMSCLAGRTGSTNDLTLSSDSGGTLYGSGVTGSLLTLHANKIDGLSAIVLDPAGISMQVGATGAMDVIRFSNPGRTRWWNTALTNYVGLVAPASMATSIDYTLPVAAPTTDGQDLVSTTAGVMSWRSDPVTDIRVGGAVCDAAIARATALLTGTDDTTAIQVALDAAPPGATIAIPSGKLCMISGKLTLKNGTTFTAAGGGGLVLSARQCVGGTFVGAPCNANTDCTALDAPFACCTGSGTGNCGNAECPSSTCSGTKFAPLAATSYPVIDVTSSVPKRDMAVVGMTIRAMQLSPYGICSGSGVRAGETCTTNDTNATTGCPTSGACVTSTPGYPAGPGKINPIDLSNAFGPTLVRDNRIVDLRVSDQVIKVGTGGAVQGNNVGSATDGVCCGTSTGCATTPPGSNGFSCEVWDIGGLNTGILDGVICTNLCFVYDNNLQVSRTGISAPTGGTNALGGSIIRNNKIAMSAPGATAIGVSVGDYGTADTNTVSILTGGTTVTGVVGLGWSAITKNVLVLAGTTVTGISGSTNEYIAGNTIVIGNGATTPTGILTTLNAMIDKNLITTGTGGTNDVGVSAQGSSHVTGNTITMSSASASARGITGNGGSPLFVQSEIAGNNITMDQASTNTVGLYAVDAAQSRIIGNFISSYTCFKAVDGAGNYTFQGNRCYFGDGPKIIVAGNPGGKFLGGYYAWGLSDPIFQIGDNTAGAMSVETAHLEIDGNTFFSQATGESDIEVLDIGKRCSNGSRTALLCTTADTNTTTGCPSGNTNCTGSRTPSSCCTGSGTGTCGTTTCPGSGTTCCDARTHAAARIENNVFLSAAAGIKLSNMTTAGNTSFIGSLIGGNIFSSVAMGILFPVTSAKVATLGINANNFATVGNTVCATSSNANCTGASTPSACCTGVGTGTCTAATCCTGAGTGTCQAIDPNWSWNYGDLAPQTPPLTMTAAQLVVGSASNGNSIYCSDCDDFCQGAGAGAWAVRVNGKWICQTTDWPLQNVREWNIQIQDQIGGAVALLTQGIDTAVNTQTGTATYVTDTTGTYGSLASAATTGNDGDWISSRFTITRTDQAPVFTAVVKTGTVITVSRWFAGLASADPMGAKAPTVHAAALTYDTSGTPDTKWMCTTCNGTTCTSTATSVTVAADTRYVLKVNSSATQTDCYVNGKLEISNTLTLPTSTTSLGYEVGVRTLENVAKSARISKVDLVHR